MTTGVEILDRRQRRHGVAPHESSFMLGKEEYDTSNMGMQETEEANGRNSSSNGGAFEPRYKNIRHEQNTLNYYKFEGSNCETVSVSGVTYTSGIGVPHGLARESPLGANTVSNSKLSTIIVNPSLP